MKKTTIKWVALALGVVWTGTGFAETAKVESLLGDLAPAKPAETAKPAEVAKPAPAAKPVEAEKPADMNPNLQDRQLRLLEEMAKSLGLRKLCWEDIKRSYFPGKCLFIRLKPGSYHLPITNRCRLAVRKK